MSTLLRSLGIPACALVLGMGVAAAAPALSKDEYEALKDRIAGEYKAVKASCDSLSGNAKDICVAEAKGKEKVAKAELEAEYKPTEKNRFNVRIAKADAEYAVAKARYGK